MAALAACLACTGPATADSCLNPDGLGTARTIEIDPARFARIGTMQYRETLPLAAKEIVLTFDDGPSPPMTSKVLDILRAECIQATFFLIGRQARAFPEMVRTIARDGHTIANHSENHVLATLGESHGTREFDNGFRSIEAALAPAGRTTAPFIRFPGLLSSAPVELYAKRKGLVVMSADFLADDWTQIPLPQMLARGLARIEAKGSGIMLLHDVKPGLVLILPKLLQELKKRGYRIVHVVPAPGSEIDIAPAPLVAEKRAPAPARPPAAKPQKLAEPPAFSFLAQWRKQWRERQTAVATASASSQ
jgi:peptidoglycan/xylan/chitin deacetylase (PgdA/CDA1 family)